MVTLVLAHLRDQALDSFLYLPETSLDDGTTSREIDAAALIDGRLVIVEAKSNAKLNQAEIAWYRHLARRTRSSRLVFATNLERWEQPTATRLESLSRELDAEGIKVEALAYSDLMPADQAELAHFVRRPELLEEASTPS